MYFSGIIHTVGPQVHGLLQQKHEEQLQSCYREALNLAAHNNLRSIVSLRLNCRQVCKCEFIVNVALIKTTVFFLIVWVYCGLFFLTKEIIYIYF